ncbi:MAG: hypothetical protein WCO05_04835, partial [Candidatus Moraniibacteriota bacterium]
MWYNSSKKKINIGIMNWNKSAKENQTKRVRKISLIFLFCCIFFPFFVTRVHASRQMEMVAYVTDKNGQLVSGDYNVRFALYSEDRTDSGASDTQGKLWEETQSVTIKNGVVRVTLGQNKELPIVTSLESGQLFLGMKIGEDSEMVPRKKVVSSIYSLSSGNAISLNGKKTGNSAGDIPVLDSAGKIELTNLPDSVLGGGNNGSGLSFSTSGQKYLTVSGQQLKLNKINLNSNTQGTLSIGQGGTGLTTAPTDGEIMIGNSAGGYTLGKFSASGNLLQLANNTFSIKEGILTEGRLCTYSLTQGLVCNTMPSAGGVETDPFFVSSVANSITNANVGNWNAAYGWGNHGSQGYLTGTKVDSFNNRTGIISLSSLDVTNALTFTPYSATNPTGFITASTVDNLTNKSGNISMWNNNVGYLSSFTEVDPALSTWAGSANLSTLGTITSGTWRGNAVATSYGGTGLASYVAGDMLYANGTNLSKLSIGGNGQVLVVSSGIPTWSSTAPGTAHSFLSSSHSDTTASSPQRGDIITGQGATASWTKLSVGTSGQVLKSDGADAYWGADTDTNTTYARGGSLLQLTGTTFSIKEGTLTDTRICTYSSTSGLVCDTSPSAGGSTYTAGNDLNLIGTQFNLDSQLDHVSTISQSSANLTFQTLISGNILLNSIGNVGIGTSAPSQKLQIVGYADATGLCINGSCKTSWNSAGIGTDYAAGNDIDITDGQIDLESQLDLVSVINRTANDLTLQTTASGNIFLMPNQNVGIGTINPLQKVDVNGNLTATAIYTNNTIRI